DHEQRLLGIVSAHDGGVLNGFQRGGSDRRVIEEAVSGTGFNAEARLVIQLNGAADNEATRNNRRCGTGITVSTLRGHHEARQTSTGCVVELQVLTRGG